MFPSNSFIFFILLEESRKIPFLNFQNKKKTNNNNNIFLPETKLIENF